MCSSDLSERGEVSRDEALERSVLARPRPVPYPVARRDVWVIGVAVVPAAGRRGGDEVRVRADESPDQPVVRSAERADRLRDVRDDVVFLSRRARVRRGQPRNDLRVDAAILGHDSAERTRILPAEYKKKVIFSAEVWQTFLVDGFVSGRYRLSATKKEAIVALEPFKPLKKADKAFLMEEGERLARFYYPDARIHGVSA